MVYNHLMLAGYVILKKPPRPPHSTHGFRKHLTELVGYPNESSWYLDIGTSPQEGPMKSWVFRHRNGIMVLFAIALGIAVIGYLDGALLSGGWAWWSANHDAVAPIFTWAGGAVAAWVALSQLSVARKRHEAQVKRDDAQTKADRHRHIQEIYTTAVEQLGSEKLQVRLGGIYTLERLYKLQHIYAEEEQSESRFVDDYWTIMETLTAFIREAINKERPLRLEQPEGTPDKEYRALATDVIAALAVIGRRPEWASETELNENLWFDLRQLDISYANLDGFVLYQASFAQSDLTGVNFASAYLPGANFEEALLNKVDFEDATLHRADLGGANLIEACLERADLSEAFLVGGFLMKASLKGVNASRAIFFAADLANAYLKDADLTDADLSEANLTGADVEDAVFEGADLRRAVLTGVENLTAAQLESAYGNSSTILPDGVTYPESWLKT